jgi:DNA-binding SARP family transcriptional activator
MKHGAYQKALRFAKKKGLIADFHRYLFYFPRAVNQLIRKGKDKELPEAMLKLPVFDKHIPVYSFKFLGTLVVYRNGKYLRVRLSPKYIAFLIHLALKAGEPGKFIPLDDIYWNFWPDAKYPDKNLSHLLIEMKRKLKMPDKFLRVSSDRRIPCLLNRGIHSTTDFDDFEQTILQARALERSGDWDIAKQEYKRAFSLFRGEPFQKMYDHWSEHMRGVTLNKLESEARQFAECCRKYGDTRDIRKVFSRLRCITPYSQGNELSALED